MASLLGCLISGPRASPRPCVGLHTGLDPRVQSWSAGAGARPPGPNPDVGEQKAAVSASQTPILELRGSEKAMPGPHNPIPVCRVWFQHPRTQSQCMGMGSTGLQSSVWPADSSRLFIWPAGPKGCALHCPKIHIMTNTYLSSTLLVITQSGSSCNEVVMSSSTIMVLRAKLNLFKNLGLEDKTKTDSPAKMLLRSLTPFQAKDYVPAYQAKIKG